MHMFYKMSIIHMTLSIYDLLIPSAPLNYGRLHNKTLASKEVKFNFALVVAAHKINIINATSNTASILADQRLVDAHI